MTITNNTAIKDIYTEKEDSQNGYNIGGYPCDENSKGIIIKKEVKSIK